MDTKVLYVSAVVIAAISGGYYYYSGKSEKHELNSSKNMTYTAEKIRLTQTDEQGNLHIRAQVDRLEQNMQAETSEIAHLTASTYRNGEVEAVFVANKAKGYENNQRVVLSDRVVATRKMSQGDLQFLTEELTALPRKREIFTESEVLVRSPQMEFRSQGLSANLTTGQYEFKNIRGTYEP